MKNEKNLSPELEKFDWIKEFVFSDILEKYVALAGVEEQLFLVDCDGKIVEYVEND
jgi:hypothetical protein